MNVKGIRAYFTAYAFHSFTSHRYPALPMRNRKLANLPWAVGGCPQWREYHKGHIPSRVLFSLGASRRGLRVERMSKGSRSLRRGFPPWGVLSRSSGGLPWGASLLTSSGPPAQSMGGFARPLRHRHWFDTRRHGAPRRGGKISESPFPFEIKPKFSLDMNCAQK